MAPLQEPPRISPHFALAGDQQMVCDFLVTARVEAINTALGGGGGGGELRFAIYRNLLQFYRYFSAILLQFFSDASIQKFHCY